MARRDREYEPPPTVPRHVVDGMRREAERHGCDSTGEFYEAGKYTPHDFPPERAREN